MGWVELVTVRGPTWAWAEASGPRAQGTLDVTGDHLGMVVSYILASWVWDWRLDGNRLGRNQVLKINGMLRSAMSTGYCGEGSEGQAK